jgi:hypothetical protein
MKRATHHTKRATHHTSLTATLAVGAELSRRGYDVAFTIGNTPRIDLLCAVPDGKAFKVQVKGISYSSGIWVQKAFFDADFQKDLFLVIVLVPLDEVSPLRFFVLSHDDAKQEFSIMPKIKKDGNPVDSWGLNWGSITRHEKKWAKLPALKA